MAIYIYVYTKKIILTEVLLDNFSNKHGDN